MIKNWDFHRLNIDFSSLGSEGIVVSDIDGYHIGQDNTLCLLEIKNETGELKHGQRRLFERLINGWRYKGLVIFATHDKYVQKHDENVDLSECDVKELYFDDVGWREPKRPTKVREVMEYFFSDEVKNVR